jgi:phosphate transport system permease protein
VLGVILPSSLAGILTGTVLAIARAAGETAPLLFTTSNLRDARHDRPVQGAPEHSRRDLPVSESPDPSDHQKAWAASLVLMAFVLIASLIARAALARSRRKLAR